MYLLHWMSFMYLSESISLFKKHFCGRVFKAIFLVVLIFLPTLFNSAEQIFFVLGLLFVPAPVHLIQMTVQVN